MFITTATSTEEAARAAEVAVLPIGSFEQHGSHLPLSTDTLIACLIARRVASKNELMLLPPVTFGCSHEHAGFTGTVSVSATTLHSIVSDIAASLAQSGIERLAIINGHGGNYVLSNVVQEANVTARRMLLFPRPEDWTDARKAAGVHTNSHDDMHGGEAETSILLTETPELVHDSYRDADHLADDRRHLLTVGVASYSNNGIIGRPSLATAEKGHQLLTALDSLFTNHLAHLRATR